MATYPIKMLRDEDRQAFVPFTNAAAVVDKDNKSLQELMDSGKYKIQNNVTTSSAGKGVLDAYQGKVLNDKFNNYVPLSQKGVANGVASLDAEGKVPSAQLPSYVDDVIESYIVSGSTALSAGWLSKTNGGTALTPEKGKIYLIMTSGSYQNKQYRWGGSTYVLCNPSDVNSVNGMTGVVTLKKLTIQKNGTQVGDTFNGTTDEVINITVPTNNNQLTNGAGYITSAGSITGNAATATQLQNSRTINTVAFDGSKDIKVPYVASEDQRTNLKPSTLKKSYLTFGFGSKGGLDGTAADQNWIDYIGLNSWENDSGGYTNVLAIRKSGDMAIYHYRGSIDSNTWGTKKTLAYTDSDITGNAATATKLQNARNITIGSSVKSFDGSAAISYTHDEMKVPYVRGSLAFNDTQVPITTAEFITLLNDLGAFNQYAWIARGSWSYANNAYISDTGCGNIHLAGCVVEKFGTNSSYTIRITTPTTTTNNGTVNAEFIYVYNGTDYAPGWRRAYNSKYHPLADEATTAKKTTGTLTIQKNGTNINTFNGSANKTINITVPTKTSELTNDSNYVKTTNYASSTAAGVVKLGTGLAIADGVLSVTGAATADSVEWSVVKNKPTAVSYWTNDAGYIKASNTMKGATATTAGSAGTVPAPAAGKEAQFLRGDGTWAVPSYATSAGSATKATQDASGNTITTTYVKKAGDTMTGVLATPAIGPASAYVAYPSGGTYTGTAGNATGYLKITLPQSWMATMITFKVMIYNYTNSTSCEYVIGGYPFGQDQKWYHCFAYCTNQPNVNNPIDNLVVRFGHDGSKNAIYIGEATTAWSNPQIFITDVTLGWANKEIQNWATGWSVGFTTTLGTITATVTKTGLNRNKMGAVLGEDNYYGLTDPSGSDSTWLRTTSLGLIPYQKGGYSSLGTSTWPFAHVYSNTEHTSKVILSEKATITYNSTDKCIDFIFE